MAKILVADDEQLIRKLIGDCLRRDGHTVLEAEDGEKALALFRQNSDVALAMLDIMMPGIDGWQVCREIRKTSGIPVMLVSARSQDFDQIMGFESGADDYVTKPFSLAVLQQRINTLLRRGARPVEEKAEPDTLTLDGLKIRTSAYEAELNGKPLELTLKEFNILTKLVSNPGRVFSRDGILNDVWGIDYVGDTRTVDSHMARLRTKLGDWGTNHIKTVYGIGYKVDKN